MMQINCPYCGPRPENEFNCGGQSHLLRPAVTCSDEAWAAYLFNRDNPKGAQSERWCHAFGCGRWFNMIRDTVTHEVGLIYAIGEPRPQARGSK